MTGQLEQLTSDVVALTKERDAGKALGDFFVKLVLHHPEEATFAASGEDSSLRQALAVLLQRAQRGGTMRKDIGVDDLLLLAVGAVAAVGHAGEDESARRRTVTVFRDGLKGRRLSRGR
ncbi:SbtR family transcriptional regulator [Virgisporangium aliadipatigenens]|nr:hypothetical protein [Virgisporangium aliadipatigenens]